jgi:cell division protein FtsX
MVSCLLQVVFLALTLNSSAQRNNLSIKKQLQDRRHDFDVAQQVHFKAVNDVAQGNGVRNITFSNPKASGKFCFNAALS